MRTAQKYLFNDKYLTIDEIVKITGLKRSTVISRIKIPPKSSSKENYKKCRELAKKYNLTADGVNYRLIHNIPLDSSPRRKKYIYCNKKMTLKEIGQLLNISLSAVLKRIRTGKLTCKTDISAGENNGL